jgi:hypothetical protein
MERMVEKMRLRADVAYSNDTPPEGFAPGSNAWRVTLRYRGRRLTVPFYTGPALGEPDAADVISCLISDTSAGEQSFEDFCSDFGYDQDSRRAEATWKACANLAPKVRGLLGEDFDTFAECEH